MGGAVYPGLCWDRLRGYVEGMVIEFLMSFLILVGLIVTLPASALLDLIVTPNNVFSTHTHISCIVAQHPVLQEVTTPRERRWCVVSDGEHRVDRDLDFMYWRMQSGTADLLQQIDELDPQDHAALVIEDIDAELYHKLFARYSTSLDAEFLAQHVLRLADLRGTHDIDHACIPEPYNAFFELVTDVRAMLSRTCSGFYRGQHFRGHHIDGEIMASPGPDWWTFDQLGSGYRREIFRK
jgi:hypothetical protein